MAKTSSNDPARSKQPPKRGGIRPLSVTVGKVAAPALRKRGLAETRIVTLWPEIVGAEMAGAACPEKLTGRGADGGTLHIRVDGALALELQHLAPLVVEKINAFFGYRAVARLKLTQGPLLPPPRRRKPSPPLTDSERARIAEMVEGIDDDKLRARLQGLGESILRHEAKNRAARR